MKGDDSSVLLRINCRLIVITTRSLPWKMIVVFLHLFALAEVCLSLGSAHDPTGWNSYFVTEHSNNIDTVDVIDPSGWNYDRGTKRSVRNNEDKNDRARQVFMFCQRVVEKGSLDTDYLVEDEINVAVKTKVAEFFNKEAIVNEHLSFVRRFISILLNTADLSNRYVEEGPDVSGVIEINVSAEHLKTLIHFSNSVANVSMRELDSILSASVHRKHTPVLSVSELIDKIFFMVRQKEIWLPVVLLLIMLCVFRLIQNGKTKTCVLTSLTVFIFTISYVVEYYRLYKEVEIKQKIILDKHSEIPSTCDPRNQVWWSALFGFSQNERECVEYHKALSLDPLVEVSPSRVLSNILSDFVLNPFNKAGETIAAFASAILGGLPFSYGWIVWLGSSVAIFVLIALVLVILIGGSIRFHWFFSGVNISGHQELQETLPSAAPAASATPVTNCGSQPLLEAVSGMSNFVLMDANSLGTLVLRAQTSVSTLHSGVQELKPEDALPLKSPFEMIVENTAQERIIRKESILNLSHETSTEKQGCNLEGTDSDAKKVCELKSQDHAKAKEELFETNEVLQCNLISGILDNSKMESNSEFEIIETIEKHLS